MERRPGLTDHHSPVRERERDPKGIYHHHVGVASLLSAITGPTIASVFLLHWPCAMAPSTRGLGIPWRRAGLGCGDWSCIGRSEINASLGPQVGGRAVGELSPHSFIHLPTPCFYPRPPTLGCPSHPSPVAFTFLQPALAWEVGIPGPCDIGVHHPDTLSP